MNSYQTARYRTTGTWLYENAELVTGKVLDVGCGDKPYHRQFPDLEWVGLDIRPVGDITADLHEMPCEDESFDTVLCTDVLQWTLEPLKAVTEMWRVLKPGGHLILIAPNTMPDDKSSLLTYPVAGLANIVTYAARSAQNGACGYGLMKQEYSRLGGRMKHAGGFPSEIVGWVDHMDQQYPVVSIVAARKE